MKSRAIAVMSGLLVVGVLLAISGCLPFPVGDPDKSQVDPKLAGYWINNEEPDRDLVAVYPFDQHTYLVEDLKMKKDGDKWVPQGAPMPFKAWLTEIKGQRFMTLEPLQQRLPSFPGNENKVYPVMRLTAQNDALQAKLVNSDFEPMKQVKSSADEEALITKELDNPNLYSGDGTTFHRLNPDTDKELIQSIAGQ